MKRSKQKLSHYHLTTVDMGYLTPVMLVEALPGDTFRHIIQALLRVTPLVRPLMHPVYVDFHCFFIPSRILWNVEQGDTDSWEDFITQNDPAAVLPTLTLTGASEDLVDRLGVPPTAGLVINALPVRAYNMIWNEFFRDEQLNSEVSLDQTTLLRAGWGKDYYTTCRPNAQQGAGAEQISFPITGMGMINTSAEAAVTAAREADGNDRNYANAWSGNAANLKFEITGTGTSARPTLSGLFDVNQWRSGMAVQKWREHRNRFGDRYHDLMAALGVSIGDARLNRPERIGGGRSVISFSEVLSTADTTGSSGQVVGDLAGHGISAARTRPYKYFCREYGYVMALMTVRPKPIYMDAIQRTFLRTAYSDFWSPPFEMEGAQEVTETEIYAPGGNSANVFGYQSRHNDYRFVPSYVSGDFRNSTSYDWHMARDFLSAPTLNGSFISCDPTDRVYADTGEPELYCMVDHSLVARRLVSQFARNP